MIEIGPTVLWDGFSLRRLHHGRPRRGTGVGVRRRVGRLVRQCSHVWDALVSYSSDLYPGELVDDIEHAYEESLVDPGYISLDDVRRDLETGKDRLLSRLAFSDVYKNWIRRVSASETISTFTSSHWNSIHSGDGGRAT